MDSAPLPKAASPHKITVLQAPASAAALAYAVLRHARAAGRLQLLVTPDSFGAQQQEQDLRALRPELPVLHFPAWETLVYDQFSPHPDLVSQRIDCLYRLPASRQGVLVVPVSSLMQRIAPPGWIAAQVLDLAVGQRLDLGEERLRLQRFGYRHVPRVMDGGDFSIRGAILDLFPSGAKQPVCSELMEESIDSLRLFDHKSQRSGETRTHF